MINESIAVSLATFLPPADNPTHTTPRYGTGKKVEKIGKKIAEEIRRVLTSRYGDL